MLNEGDMIRRDHCEYLNVLLENLYKNEIGRKPRKFLI